MRDLGVQSRVLGLFLIVTNLYLLGWEWGLGIVNIGLVT